MRLTKQDFNYELPQHLVAHQPLSDRSEARLLVASASGINDSKVSQLGRHLPENALVIRNNSRVIPSRILGQTIHGGKVEIMLLEPVMATDQCIWKAIGKPMKKLRPGTTIEFPGLSAKILEAFSGDTPYFTVQFPLAWEDFYQFVESDGIIPLPPYIKRENPKRASESEDTERYQTVYAGPRGSVAAPTAGLHFTPTLIKSLQQDYSIDMIDVTLHVGAGTFLPVKTDDIDTHEMHSERYQISQDSWQVIKSAIKNNRPIVTIGTTSFRCMQSFFQKAPFDELDYYTNKWFATELFIYPKTKSDRFHPKYITALMTNFHQPESTLIMLISALMGYGRTMEIYQHAIEKEYRFYSYGDSSLLLFN